MTLSERTGIAVEVLREAVERAMEREEVDAAEVAERLGWTSRNWADVTRLRRTLGIRDEPSGHRPPEWRGRRRYVGFEVAKQLCDALHIDYHEVGL